MKRWKRSSRSTSRETLFLQGSRDKQSGLLFAGRVFIPEQEKKPQHLLWFFSDALTLFLVIAGLFLLMITGFSLEVHAAFFAILVPECLVAVWICRSRWKKKIKILIAFVILILTAVALFLIQYAFLNGAQAFYIQARTTLQQTYNESGTNPMIVGNAVDMAMFLSGAAWLTSLWVAYSVFEKENFLQAMLLLFPLLAGIVLCGGGDSVIPLFMLLFGILGCFSLTRNVRHKRLWGDGNELIYQKNLQRHQRLQKKNLYLILLSAIVLTIPGFYLVRPVLNLRLHPAERVAHQVQSAFLSKVLAVLPEITADQWNLEVKSVGGGVSEGALQDVDGYQLKGVEDLKLTASEQPTETIYLKGFIGGRYQDNTWEGGYETSFDGASMNWKIDGDRRLYIQNLQFLRMSYAIEHMTDKEISSLQQHNSDPALLSVERLNANTRYTYIPYGVFLNDYYKVANGDGYVEGQYVNDDSYYYFYRDEMEEILSLWGQKDGKKKILDRVEESYRVYCNNNYMDLAEGLDQLKERVDQAIQDDKLDPEFDRDQIIAWVRAFLAENYEYDINVDKLEEGQDFLTTFLFETQKGYSIHFASAAVEMFRMFGIPARYVVGYEAPAAIFTVQTDGTYTAILQDDNSQAWAEIYIPSVGWMPVDVTPGMVGTLEEVGPGGEKIKTYEYNEENLKMNEKKEDQEEEKVPIPQRVLGGLTAKINAILHTQMTVEEVVHAMILLTLLIVLLIYGILLGKRICRNYGYDPFRKRTSLQRLIGIFGAYYTYLRKKGLPEGVDSASEEFLSFAESYRKKKKKKSQAVELLEMRDAIYACCFGDQKVKEEDILKMRKLYIELRR